MTPTPTSAAAPPPVHMERSVASALRMVLYPYDEDNGILSDLRVAAWSNVTSLFVEQRLLSMDDGPKLQNLSVTSIVRAMEVLNVSTAVAATASASASTDYSARLSILFDVSVRHRQEASDIEVDLLVHNAWHTLDGRPRYIQDLKRYIPELKQIVDFDVDVPGFSTAGEKGDTADIIDNVSETSLNFKARIAVIVGSIVGSIALVILFGMCFAKRRRRSERKPKRRRPTEVDLEESSLEQSSEEGGPNQRANDHASVAVSATTSRAVMSVASTVDCMSHMDGSTMPISDVTTHSAASAKTARIQNKSRPSARSGRDSPRRSRNQKGSCSTPTIFEI